MYDDSTDVITGASTLETNTPPAKMATPLWCPDCGEYLGDDHMWCPDCGVFLPAVMIW